MWHHWRQLAVLHIRFHIINMLQLLPASWPMNIICYSWHEFQIISSFTLALWFYCSDLHFYNTHTNKLAYVCLHVCTLLLYLFYICAIYCVFIGLLAPKRWRKCEEPLWKMHNHILAIRSEATPNKCAPLTVIPWHETPHLAWRALGYYTRISALASCYFC